MMSYSDAILLIRKTVKPLKTQQYQAQSAFGQILAADIISDENLPPFDNSAMDGAAFYTGGNPLKSGTEFDVIGLHAAGNQQVSLAADLQNSACYLIMTGARMPFGADSVMPVEQLEILNRDSSGRATRVRLLSDLLPYQNVRLCGEDVARGDLVLQSGRRVDAAT